MSKGEVLCSQNQSTCSEGTNESSSYEKGLLALPEKEPFECLKSSSSTVSTNDSISSIDSSEFRAVRFCTEQDYVQIIENCFCLSPEDRTKVWYGREELQQMKMESRTTADQVRSNAKLRMVINSSHDLSIFIAEYSGQASDDMKSVTTILSGEMKTWVASTVEGEACRGIENLLLRQGRSAFAKDARNAVVDTESYMSDEDAQNMADKYRAFSMPATTFAKAIARADEAEVGR